MTSKQVTLPPWNSGKLVHSKEMVWAWRWSVALRAFYRQILSLLYSSFFFWNFRPRLARELLVYVTWCDIFVIRVSAFSPFHDSTGAVYRHWQFLLLKECALHIIVSTSRGAVKGFFERSRIPILGISSFFFDVLQAWRYWAGLVSLLVFVLFLFPGFHYSHFTCASLEWLERQSLSCFRCCWA